MSKSEQVLMIEPPSELRFRGPFTGNSVMSYLKLTNPTDRKVYFKIKTTAPKKYCVRPNSGCLLPKEVTEIAVCLQAQEFEPSDKNKHKFMVQTLIAPEGDTDDNVYDSVWKSAKPNQLMDSKLKCVFENPVDPTNTTEHTTNASVTQSGANAANGKNKGTGDSVKSSPKPAPEVSKELEKAALVVQQLRIEESNLRQENIQLKEELLKLGSANLETATRDHQLTSLISHSGGLAFDSPTFTVAAAVAILVLGYLLGKLI
ncbi:vesicle-associated membrane protein-associated protein B [Orussus abietinus]|uniref:vesicle-associated membrane protein-associated protein B n=1 Tax=Orussus abietinus TaxID=222816 RepID=UPI00062687B3|nr:vesicle-associated membrane protein-associated protein B [Orussus abietinus]